MTMPSDVDIYLICVDCGWEGKDNDTEYCPQCKCRDLAEADE